MNTENPRGAGPDRPETIRRVYHRLVALSGNMPGRITQAFAAEYDHELDRLASAGEDVDEFRVPTGDWTPDRVTTGPGSSATLNLGPLRGDEELIVPRSIFLKRFEPAFRHAEWLLRNGFGTQLEDRSGSAERPAEQGRTAVDGPRLGADHEELLCSLVKAHWAVAPGEEQSFKVVHENGRQWLEHPGIRWGMLEGEMLPDWKAMRVLEAAGHISFEQAGPHVLFVEITDTGLEYCAQIERPRATLPAESGRADVGPGNNRVWITHGHDLEAREVLFALLNSVGLLPLEFEQAAELTGKPSPTIMEILNAAFDDGQAFIVLFTPDEEAVPSEKFRDVDEPGPQLQPRPNVVLEAGMALALHPDRTIIVEMGRVREISDLDGLHLVKWLHDTPEIRRRLLRKLKLARCPVNDSGDYWMTAGRRSR